MHTPVLLLCVRALIAGKHRPSMPRIMREIVFDTETTGLDPKSGDRIVEIGGIELLNHIPTGRSFHRYLNPERSMPIEAGRVHGLDDAFLKDKPLFAAIADEIIEFFGDANLIAHNASFDIAFLNAEFARIGRPPLGEDRVIDTLMLARRKHPGSPASLDALMSRYQVDASRRTLHGALLDAELLSEVYIELIGGRQAALTLGDEREAPTITVSHISAAIPARTMPRVFAVSAEELAAHAAVVAALGDKALWRRYQVPAAAA
jgi:DNA polymerase-3 subunit epsilon